MDGRTDPVRLIAPAWAGGVGDGSPEVQTMLDPEEAALVAEALAAELPEEAEWGHRMHALWRCRHTLLPACGAAGRGLARPERPYAASAKFTPANDGFASRLSSTTSRRSLCRRRRSRHAGPRSITCDLLAYSQHLRAKKKGGQDVRPFPK